jgi:hypothetical protein
MRRRPATLACCCLVMAGLVACAGDDATIGSHSLTSAQATTPPPPEPEQRGDVRITLDKTVVRAGEIVRLSISGPPDMVYGPEVNWQEWRGVAWVTVAELRSPPGVEDATPYIYVLGTPRPSNLSFASLGYSGPSFQKLQIPEAAPRRYRLEKKLGAERQEHVPGVQVMVVSGG